MKIAAKMVWCIKLCLFVCLFFSADCSQISVSHNLYHTTYLVCKTLLPRAAWSCCQWHQWQNPFCLWQEEGSGCLLSAAQRFGSSFLSFLLYSHLFPLLCLKSTVVQYWNESRIWKEHKKKIKNNIQKKLNPLTVEGLQLLILACPFG